MCGIVPDTGRLVFAWKSSFSTLLHSRLNINPNFLDELIAACTSYYTPSAVEVVWLAVLYQYASKSQDLFFFLPLSVLSKDEKSKLFTSKTFSLHQALFSSSLLKGAAQRNANLVKDVFSNHGVTLGWLHSCGSINVCNPGVNIYEDAWYLQQQSTRSALDHVPNGSRIVSLETLQEEGQIDLYQLEALYLVLELTNALADVNSSLVTTV